MRVRKCLTFAKFWLPVLVWCGVIFIASSDSNSVHHSSRLLGPFLKWLLPRLTDAQLGDVVFFCRKCAHAAEYAVLACLLWRALRDFLTDNPARNAVAGRLAWCCATFYAATDELHQHFVANRQGSVWDVLLDSLGALAGLAILWGIRRWRKVG